MNRQKLVAITEGSGEDRSQFLNRSRIDIMADIIENSRGRVSKTKLMCKSNLNSSQMNLYLSLLVEGQLLKASGWEEGEVLEPTEKGKEFLEDYKKIRDVLARL